jgi:hypothetical protein
MNGKLSRTLVYEYSQALQVLDLLKNEALTPYVASQLAIIFIRSEKQDNLTDILEWLFNYITPYLYSVPRDQSDVREKTLAISTYYLLEDPQDQRFSLPNEFLNRYLDYASKQDWYGDTFLAFITCLLADKHTISRNALDYFKRKYPNFLEQQDIQAISQALYLLPELEESLKEPGFTVIRASLENPYSQTYEKSWGLIGISTSGNKSDFEIHAKLKTSQYNELAPITTAFFSKLIPQTVTTDHTQSSKTINASDLNENGTIESRDDEETLSYQFPDLDIAELCLITFSIFLSNSFFNLSIIGITEKQIIEFIDHENKTSKGFIQISKSANIIGNILAIIFTLMVGALAINYLFGLKFEKGQILSTSTPALSDLLLLPVWADYLLSQIQAVFRGESALEGMKVIPLVRHLFHFRKNKGS